MTSIENARVKSLIDKIDVIEDANLTSNERRKRAAIVEVLTGGKCYRKQIDFPKGEPENPMSLCEIEEKFVNLTVFGGKTKEEARHIISCVWDIKNQMDALYGAL